jgi:hypothetical protein
VIGKTATTILASQPFKATSPEHDDILQQHMRQGAY